MDEKMQKKDPVLRVLLSFGRILLVFALIVYLLYHLTNGFSKDMKTLVVKPVTEELSVSASGMIVRDEVKISADTSGVISYTYADGEKVKINSKVATVYPGNGNGDAVSRIAEIDRAIELLSLAEIDENTRVSDAGTAKKEISGLLGKISDGVSRKDYGGVYALADALLAASVRRNTILSGEGAGETISELKAERDMLMSTLSGVSSVARTPVAGYFYSYTDGGEDLFDFSSVESLTPAEYSVKESFVIGADKNSVGKIVLSPFWYLVLPLEYESAKAFRAGQSYDVVFGGDGVTLSMRLAAKNEGDGESLLVFKSNIMPSGFSFDRVQNVTVVSGSIKGYKIPASALRVVDGLVGVYVQSGNNIKFRVVEQISESGAYTFVRTDTKAVSVNTEDIDPENDRTYGGIALYDAVIIGGAKDLSPDRIID